MMPNPAPVADKPPAASSVSSPTDGLHAAVHAYRELQRALPRDDHRGRLALNGEILRCLEMAARHLERTRRAERRAAEPGRLAALKRHREEEGPQFREAMHLLACTRPEFFASLSDEEVFIVREMMSDNPAWLRRRGSL
jgi:hypothetical protein